MSFGNGNYRVSFLISAAVAFDLLIFVSHGRESNSPASDSQAVLTYVRTRMAKSLERSPRYACINAIQRYWYGKEPPFTPRDACPTEEGIEYKLVKKDRLRLEVSVIGGVESYSWPGAGSLDIRRVDQLVEEGPISSGTFFAFLSDLFVEGNARYAYLGGEDVNGRRVARYRFSVPAQASHFITPSPKGDLAVPYSGKFEADVASGLLRGLEIRTAALGTEAPFCSARIEAQYADLQAGLFLPVKVTLDVTNRDGSETRSVIAYNGCREFVASSVIHFAGTYSTPAATPRPTRLTLGLPAGLPLRIRLITPIHPAASWAGDAIEGALETSVKLPLPRDLSIPKGARVQGRLVRIEQHLDPHDFLTIALTFNAIDIGGERYAVSLAPVAGSLSTSAGVIRRKAEGETLRAEDKTVASFQLPQNGTGLRKGFVSQWVTTGDE
jgi:hypothetical protein